MSAGGVAAARPANQRAGGGAGPTSALQTLQVRPIPVKVAKEIVVLHHYLHSLPGGTRLAFGVFLGRQLLGALTLGVGPYNAHRLVEGTASDDCLTLSRLWLDDRLLANSESRVLGVVLRNLRRHTNLKFIVSYADPAHGHLGIIYQATGWTYTGLSEATASYDLGDGKVRHSRSLGHAFGTRSVHHFAGHGIEVKLLPQSRKHRYLYFLEPAWRARLRGPVLPYPKKETSSGTS